MEQLIILNETWTNGFNYSFFNILKVMSVIFGILVIVTKNPVLSVLFLICLFLSVSFYLMVLGITFIGLSYILVYVGAVSILFLFILMLINIRISELTSNSTNSIPLSIISVVLITLAFTNLLPLNNSYLTTPVLLNNNLLNNIDVNTKEHLSSNNILSTLYENMNIFNNDLYFAISNSWEGTLAESSQIAAVGNVIYTIYPLWLILTSFILLLAMVGAIIITVKQ